MRQERVELASRQNDRNAPLIHNGAGWVVAVYELVVASSLVSQMTGSKDGSEDFVDRLRGGLRPQQVRAPS